MRTAIILAFFGLIMGVAFITIFTEPEDIRKIAKSEEAEIERHLQEVIEEHGINTAAISVIKDGKVQWTRSFGQQSRVSAVSESTLFNVASITKTVIAETVLSLVAENRISLDEPMFDYWVDPDLMDDPRHKLLTPRMILSHTSGFMNWRFFAEDGKLKFVSDPGTTYGYSGEGYKYLAEFVERKLGEPLEQLVDYYVFTPLELNNASLTVRSDLFAQIAQTLDQDGQFHGHYCRPEGWCREEGSFSASGDMVISLSEYTKFLISTMTDERLGIALTQERNSIVEPEAEYDCRPVPDALCPDRSGYGLGWHVFDLQDGKTVGHLGSDWSMVTLAYYYEDSHDGLVVFLNAPNAAGISAMVDILDLLDPDSPELHGYVARSKRL